MSEPALNFASNLLSAGHVTDALESRISNYLHRRSGVSLCEMSRDIPGFTGSSTWGRGDLNIVLWADMSEEAIAAMGRLLKAEEIVPTATNWLVYNFDGGVLDMPIAKDFQKRYPEPHWFPIVFAGNREAA